MLDRRNDARKKVNPKTSATTTCTCSGCGYTFEVKVPADGALPISGALGFGEALFMSAGERRPDRQSGSSPFTCRRCGLTN